MVVQERTKSKLEKVNERRNKQNRSNKRRGDRGTSNERQKRAVRAKMRSSQGDRPHEGDLTGRPVRNKNRVSSRPSMANWAKPNPYAGKPRRSEASAAKAAFRNQGRRPVTATRTGERPYRTSISGGRISSRNISSARVRTYPRPMTYSGRKSRSENVVARNAARNRIYNTASVSGTNKRVYNRPLTYSGIRRRTESDMAKDAVRMRQRPSTGTRKGEVGRTTTVDGKKTGIQRSVVRSGRKFRAPVGPYTGKKRRSENDIARTAANLQRRPSTISRKGEQSTNRTIDGSMAVPRTTTGSTRTVFPRTNTYAGRKQVPEGKRAQKNARRFSAPISLTAQQGPPRQRNRIVPRTITSAYRVSKRKSPYGASRPIRSWEKGYTMDITGRKFRRKDPSTLPPPRKPSFDPYVGRPRMGDKPYASDRRLTGRPPSLTRPTEKGWRGSISGGKIVPRTTQTPRFTQNRRIDPYFGRKRSGDSPYRGRMTGGYQSVTRSNEEGRKRRPSFQGGRNLSITGQNAVTKKPTGGRALSITGQNAVTRRPKGGRTLSITEQFKGPGQGTYSPYYGRKRMGDRPYSGRITPNLNSITRGAEDGANRRPKGGRTLSITEQFKGPGQGTYSPYYGRKKKGDRPYNGIITPNMNSITRGSEDGTNRRPNYSGGRNLSITGQNIARRRPVGGRTMSITRGAEDGAGRRPKDGRTLSVTADFKGPGQRTFDPYYRRRVGGDRPYQGLITPNKNSVTRGSEDVGRRQPYLGTKNLSVTGKYVGKAYKSYPVRTTSTSSNNDGKPLAQKHFGKNSLIVGVYSGSMKARKPDLGGGSVSRNDWNNKGNPIPGKQYDRSAFVVGTYSGNIKARKPETGGGSVSRSGWNNQGESITRKDVTAQIYEGARFRGSFKRSELIPDKSTAHLNYQGNTRRNQLIPELRDDYVNYSGNIKVTRKTARNYHPSFYMHRDLQLSAEEERDKMFSIKILWAKLFRSNSPKNKKKLPELRFDEREQGLWYN